MEVKGDDVVPEVEAGRPLFEEKKPTKDSRNVTEVSTSYSRKKQLLATLCATMGCFVHGGVIGYTGPANPSLMDPSGTTIFGEPFTVDFQTVSWITSLLGLGAFIGSFISGYIMEKIGRKYTLLGVTAGTFFLSYILIVCAVHISMIYIGRILAGMGLGFELCTVTVYIVEIATLDMRGFLGCFVQLLGCVGILYTFCVGAVVDWKMLAIANMMWALVFAGCMYFAPESPRWLIMKGREYSALRSLEWLRGKDDRDAIEKEIEIIKKDIALSKKKRVSFVTLFHYWKPFLVSLVMMFILHFSGFTILIYYTINIFQFSRSDVKPQIAGIIVGLTLLISCVLAILVVARLNRKVMLVWSIFGMAVCQFVLGYCMYHNEQHKLRINDMVESANMSHYNVTSQNELVQIFEEENEFPGFLGWLPLLAVIGFLFLGNAGYGTLIWVVSAEILPPKVRSVGNSISICFGFIGGFLVAKTFVDLIIAIQNSGTFYLYSAVCFAGFLFVLLFVPETKNKKAEEIEAFFNRNLFQCFKDALCCT